MAQSARSRVLLLFAGVAVLASTFLILKKIRAEPSQGSTPPKNEQTAKSASSSGSHWRVALDDSLQESSPGVRSAHFGRDIQAWFEEDPEGALAYLREMSPSNEFTAGLLVVLRGIAKDDPERALLLAEEMAVRPEDWIVYNVLFADFAKKDIQLAQTLLSLVPRGEPLEKATRAMVTGWAREDFPAAWTWARNLDQEDNKGPALEAALAIHAKTNPEDCFALAQEHLKGKAQHRILLETIQELINRDPHLASGYVSQLPEGETREASVLNVVRALAREQPDAVLQWLEEFEDSRLRDLAMNNLLDVWSEGDPSAARNFVNSLPPGESLNRAAAQLAKNLAVQDPQTASAWAEQLPSTEARNAAYLGLASSWARRNPADAVQWVVTFPEDLAIREEALQGTFSYWALLDPEEASGFVSQLTESEQPDAINTVAHPLTEQDSQTAIEWAQSFENEDIQNLAVDAVVRSWSRIAPSETGAWVLNQPDNTTRIDLARAVTENWYQRDPEGSTTWVQSIPTGPTRDGTLDMLAAQVAPSNLEEALSIAATIDSVPLREARTANLQKSAGE